MFDLAIRTNKILAIKAFFVEFQVIVVEKSHITFTADERFCDCNYLELLLKPCTNMFSIYK